MKLYVLRHGHALPPNNSTSFGGAEAVASADFARELSSKGREEVAASVKKHVNELNLVDRVYVSPLVRAQQTLQMVLQHVVINHVEDLPLLTPESNLDRLIEHLSGVLEALTPSSMLLVSHQPLVAKLIEELCGLDRGHALMQTASLASLDMDVVAKGCATLDWIFHPQNA